MELSVRLLLSVIFVDTFRSNPSVGVATYVGVTAEITPPSTLANETVDPLTKYAPGMADLVWVVSVVVTLESK